MSPKRKAKTKLLPPKRIVITGGPSGGKTTLLETLQKEFAHLTAVVPEAASLLYRGGFPRLTSKSARKHAQRSIYFIQREYEDLMASEHSRMILVCDRGTLDGVAYWPGPAESYFKDLGTSLKSEIQRYDWVLHLDTATGSAYDSLNNPIRTESAKEALVLNQRVRKAWSPHPRRIILNHQTHFLDKIAKAIHFFQLLLSGVPEEVIRSQFVQDME